MPREKVNEMQIRKMNLLPIVERMGTPTNETWPEVEK